MVKAKKRKKPSPWKFFTVFTIILVITTTIIGVGLYYLLLGNTLRDSSLTGEEILENQQNTIPKDVLAQIQKGKQVLGANNTFPKSTPVRVPILMYHYIEYVQDPGDKLRIALNTTPYTLEQEILTLQHAGYTFMTMSELAHVLDGNATLPPNPIVLTFDDGYRDFYTDAYPILKKYNIKATQYVIAGFLDRPNHLTTQELQEIAQNGFIEIGAHTVHHVWLKGLAQNVVTYEVTRSKEMLEELIHKPIVSFAYPFGAFDMHAITAVEKAGFTNAASTIPGITQSTANRYFLYRLRPGGRIGPDLLTWLTTVTDPINK